MAFEQPGPMTCVASSLIQSCLLSAEEKCSTGKSTMMNVCTMPVHVTREATASVSVTPLLILLLPATELELSLNGEATPFAVCNPNILDYIKIAFYNVSRSI